jgi:hypothetical protein
MSLKHISFHGFNWSEEEGEEDEATIGGAMDFGPVTRAIQESDSVTEVAFHECNFPTRTQIQHLKAMLANPHKPRTLILGRGTLFNGLEDDEYYASLFELKIMMHFLGELVTNSPGLCPLDVREFHEFRPEIPSRRLIIDALKEDTCSAVKSVLFGILSSQDLDDLIQSLPLFPHLRKIQFELTAEQEVSHQKALLFGSLFRNVSLHCIDSSAPVAQEERDDDDDSKKEEHIFLNMIGKRNQHLLDLLWDFSHENNFCTPIHFVPFLLENSLKVACPLHVHASFQSLLRLEEYQGICASPNDG